MNGNSWVLKVMKKKVMRPMVSNGHMEIELWKDDTVSFNGEAFYFNCDGLGYYINGPFKLLVLGWVK